MKNKQRKFSTLLWMAVVVVLLIPVSLAAQQPKNETRDEKKQRQKLAQEARYLKARQAILDSMFVVTAESLQFRNGETFAPVQSTINFLKVTGNVAVVQIGSDYSRTRGSNSLGGFTIKGEMTDVMIKEKENKKQIYMTFTINGILGRARIALTITGDDLAVVDVNNVMRNYALTMRGAVILPEDALIFEGTEF
ncbi:MAG: DUF4251 domain-containing protein [Clostridia bacterium]|nr:DUF4251 domain-containing protein [Clostridia bacterium]